MQDADEVQGKTNYKTLHEKHGESRSIYLIGLCPICKAYRGRLLKPMRRGRHLTLDQFRMKAIISTVEFIAKLGRQKKTILLQIYGAGYDTYFVWTYCLFGMYGPRVLELPYEWCMANVRWRRHT